MVFFTAALYLASGTLSGLANSLTIGCNALLSICVKSERSLQFYIGASISIVGILMMTQPPLLFNNVDLPPAPIVNWTSPYMNRAKNMEVEGLSAFSITNIKSNRTNVIHNKNISINGTYPFNSTNVGINGTYLLNSLFVAVEDAYSGSTRGQVWVGILLAALSGGSDSVWYHTTCRCVQHLSPIKLAFWLAVLGSVVSAAVMAVFENPVLPANSVCWGLAIAHSIGISQAAVVLPWSLQGLEGR